MRGRRGRNEGIYKGQDRDRDTERAALVRMGGAHIKILIGSVAIAIFCHVGSPRWHALSTIRVNH